MVAVGETCPTCGTYKRESEYDQANREAKERATAAAAAEHRRIETAAKKKAERELARERGERWIDPDSERVPPAVWITVLVVFAGLWFLVAAISGKYLITDLVIAGVALAAAAVIATRSFR